MALHTDLPIYKPAVALLSLSFAIQANMHRSLKRSLGDKICTHCVEMIDLMAMANACQGAQRILAIDKLMKQQRTLTVLLRVAHDSKQVGHEVWGQSVQLLDSIGKQGHGWRKSAFSRTGPAA